MTGSPYLLQAQLLSCIRDQRVLFEALSFDLAAGTIAQVEGANGSGKSSLLRILCGLLLPQKGQVIWRGTDIQTNRAGYYSELLYIGHALGLKDELTTLENVAFYAAVQGGETSAVDACEDALYQVGLSGYEDTLLRNLSAGQKRRVALARLWLASACLWLLDEPLTALDSDAVNNLQHQLQQHAKQGGIVVLTSHQELQLNATQKLRLG